MKKTIGVFGVIFSYFLHAQNLVPNSSFELAKTDPSGSITAINNFTCDDWASATKGTPDYFTSERLGDFSVPNNLWGRQKPNSGEAYVGIVVNHMGQDMYEYIQTKLRSKLIKDSYYCFSLFISSSDNENYSTNELDYVLSAEKLFQNTDGLIKINSFEKFEANKGFVKSKGWNKISACFKAKGNEEYLTIGVLNEKYKRFGLKGRTVPFTGMYFYIDDVSLIQINDTKDCKCNELIYIQSLAANYDLALDKPMVLKNINFENNKAQLLPSSNKELEKLVNYLKLNAQFKIEIIGYTDNVGNEKDNLTLSNARAKSVADFLITSGIPKDRVTYKGLGSSMPIKPNDTKENRLFNRRVEFRIIK